MKVEIFRNLEAAVGSFQKTDQYYQFVPHSLELGDGVNRHIHPNATEWIVLPKSEVQIYCDGETDVVKTIRNQFSIVTIRKGLVHGLIPLTPVSYFVFRDDLTAETIWVGT